MGFAGALRELGMPRSEFLMGLLTFNLGVEAGQLTIVALASSSSRTGRATAAVSPLLVVPASLAIALAGMYWTVTRLFVT